MSNTTPHFKTRARLLYQLGGQLIKDGSIALIELVKNSYDADAEWCDIMFDNSAENGRYSIIVQDNGIGMSKDEILSSWLEIGTDNKNKKKDGHLTPVYKRYPLGEKGIGRFGVHRLGHKIEIITKKRNCKECVLSIDWDSIDEFVYIDEIPISLEERDPILFKDHSGTKIVISNLRDQWNEDMIKDVARQISSLNSPFQSLDKFTATIKIGKNGVKEPFSFDLIKKSALYTFNAVVRKSKIVKFSYDFTPYQEMSKVSPRHLSEEDLKLFSKDDLVRKIGRNKYESVDISRFGMQEFRIEGMIFDLEKKILKLGAAAEYSILTEYLKKNGGVRVYRDNMRVWDYGEIGNDWLELDARRVNRPAYRISNNIILSAVYLDGATSEQLKEKSNREGFVDDDAFKEFKDACSYVIQLVESYRNVDKELVRKRHFAPSDVDKPVVDSIEDVKKLVLSNVTDQAITKRICKQLDRISEDYTRITSDLMKSAGAGINLIAVLHQIEKILKNLKSDIKQKEIPSAIVLNDVNMLSSLVDGYSILVRNCKIEKRSIRKLINYSLDCVKFRLKDHGIDASCSDELEKNDFLGYCSDNYFVNAMMNLLDNSIWWLKYAKIEKPKIYVTVSEIKKGYYTVVVADNGPGFAIPKEILGTAFVSAKPAGLGMGIGLHLTKEIMIALDGELFFPDGDAFDIPNEFKKGAIVALSFKKD